MRIAISDFDVSKLSRLPWLTMAMIVGAVMVFVRPQWSMWFQYDRAAIESGQWWRVLSCHWTHWSMDHLFWDGFALAVLGTLIETWPNRPGAIKGWRTRFLAMIAVSALCICLAVWLVHPDMTTYRGLSGLDSALFAMLSMLMLRENLDEQHWGGVAAVMALFIAFSAKILFEVKTGSCFFVDSRAGAMVPLPLVHIIGAFVGVVFGAISRSRKNVRGSIQNQRRLEMSQICPREPSRPALKPQAG